MMLPSPALIQTTATRQLREHLSATMKRAANGEEIVVTRRRIKS